MSDPTTDHRAVLFHNTPIVLLSSSYDPAKIYAIYCCLLIVFSATLRVMIAFKPSLDKRGWGTRWEDGHIHKLSNGTWVRVGDDRVDELELQERNAGLGPNPGDRPWTPPPRVPGYHRHNLRGIATLGLERLIRSVAECFIVFCSYVLFVYPPPRNRVRR